jgi:hypothetical protein
MHATHALQPFRSPLITTTTWRPTYRFPVHQVIPVLFGFSSLFCLLASYFIVLPLREDAAIALGASRVNNTECQAGSSRMAHWGVSSAQHAQLRVLQGVPTCNCKDATHAPIRPSSVFRLS